MSIENTLNSATSVITDLYSSYCVYHMNVALQCHGLLAAVASLSLPVVLRTFSVTHQMKDAPGQMTEDPQSIAYRGWD